MISGNHNHHKNLRTILKAKSEKSKVK